MEGHFVNIKEKLQHEELSILNVCAQNAKALSFMKETLLEVKACIAPQVVILPDFNNRLSLMDRSRIFKLYRSTVKITAVFFFLPKVFNKFL